LAIVISRFCYEFLSIYGEETNYYCKSDETCYSQDEMMATVENGYLKEDFVEIPKLLFSDISKQFLNLYNVYCYSMKKVSDMSNRELIRVCHWYCEENMLNSQFEEFEKAVLSKIAIKWCDDNGIKYTTKNYYAERV